MNKVGKSWNFGKIPDATSRFFCEKKLWVFHSISMKWNFPNIGKSSKKVRKKSSKIKNRENQFVFDKMLVKYTRAHLVVVEISEIY